MRKVQKLKELKPHSWQNLESFSTNTPQLGQLTIKTSLQLFLFILLTIYNNYVLKTGENMIFI